LRRTICLAYLCLLLLSVLIIDNARCLTETKINGKKGNASDPNGDIVEVDFQFVQNKTFTIKYLIEGTFTPKYAYGIDFFAYEENRTFASIILGTEPNEHKRGVFLIDQDTLKITPLTYSIQGSTLTITDLTPSQLGDRYAFHVLAKTVVEANKNVAWVDYEPRQGYQLMIFPSPTPKQTQPPTTPPPPTNPTQTIPTETTTPALPTSHGTQTTIIIIIAFIALAGIVLARSESKKKTQTKVSGKK